MADNPTPDTSQALAGIPPGLLADYLRTLDKPLPDVSPDTTPAKGGLFTRIVSALGEFAGSPGPETLKALSPQERQDAGLQALSRFGTGLLQASGSGQWIGTNLGTAFSRAEKGYDQTGREAVGMLAARQGYAVEQQRDQLARIKEALPLLTLAQQQALVGRVPYSVGGGGGGGAPGFGSGGGGSGQVNVPPEYLPFYQEASARTGIPIEVLIAQGKQEGNFDPTATGKAGEIGIHQILPSTAQSPGFGMAGVDPKTLRDPRTNINFAADYLKARGGPRNDFSSPATVAAALKNFNGGGDPNYVANVLRYVPGAMAAVAPGGAPAPPVPVGTQPPGTPPVATPPPVTVAGPGAGTTSTASPEASPAPSLLPGAMPPSLTGPGGAPAPVPPPAPTTAPPVFNYRPSQIPPGLIPPGTFTPAQQAAMKTIEDAYVHERQVAATPADVQKAESNFGTNMTKVLGSQTDAAKVATDALLKFHEADFKQQQDTHAKMLDDYLKGQQAEQTQKYKLAEIAASGEQTRQSTAAGAVVNRNNKALEALDVDSKAAANSIPQLEALRALSDNVRDESSGTLTKLATIPFHGTTLLNRMAQLGLADPTKVGPIQMLQGGISGAVAQLRQGMSMGALSDRDLSFIESLGPSLYEDPATRSAVISYLQQSQRAKLRFNVEVNKEMTKPNMNVAEAVDNAQRTMESKHPIVPQVPPEIYAARGSPDPAIQARVRQWAVDNNVKQNSLIRKPDGYLELVR